MTTLSICIATIPERSEQFVALVAELERQPGAVEIISDDSPRGTITIGAKRQRMNQRATGTHVAHIDDDDWIPPDYLPTILAGLQSDPDCIGHYELCEGMGPRPELAVWTNAAPAWATGSAAARWGCRHVRTPFHKTPIRRSIALQVPFPDTSFGEDHDFSKRLKAARLIGSEVFIPRVLQFYRYKFEPHQVKYGIRA